MPGWDERATRSIGTSAQGCPVARDEIIERVTIYPLGSVCYWWIESTSDGRLGACDGLSKDVRQTKEICFDVGGYPLAGEQEGA